MKKTKIIASIGPASSDPAIMEQMVNVGMNVARINFSHATMEERKTVVSSVKKVRKETGKPIAILYDTKGPEFRNGVMQSGGVELVEGSKIRIVKESVIGNVERFSVNHPQALDGLEKGSSILLENGLMKLDVISREDDGVTCQVVNGGVLESKKSLNVPGVHLDIPFISDVDREDIIYACRHDGNFLALSFVNSFHDVLAVREILKEEQREDMKLISKIESATGIENLESIIEVSDGVMVARGDLGVEVPMEELPIYQKQIIEMCRKYGKFCIVATEMLESMKKNARPTRAEVSDVANAVLDGADAVMLSGETTMGKFPIDTVRYMANICENAEKHFNYDQVITPVGKHSVTQTIARSVVDSVHFLDAKVIVTATRSGYSAISISDLKPRALILALCPNENVAYSLALNWGIYPVVVDIYLSTDELVAASLEEASKFMSLKPQDKIVITGGFPIGQKFTNFMKIEEV